MIATTSPAIASDRTMAAGRSLRFNAALVAALLGFFIVTFDAVVVNVALPTIQRELGSSVAGLLGEGRRAATRRRDLVVAPVEHAS